MKHRRNERMHKACLMDDRVSVVLIQGSSGIAFSTKQDIHVRSIGW